MGLGGIWGMGSGRVGMEVLVGQAGGMVLHWPRGVHGVAGNCIVAARL